MEEMKQKREKVKQAVALSYDPEEDAPKVIASGRGALAERIIERAKEANVAVHRDDKLADTLSRLETLPETLFAGNPSAYSMNEIFWGCTGLKEPDNEA